MMPTMKRMRKTRKTRRKKREDSGMTLMILRMGRKQGMTNLGISITVVVLQKYLLPLVLIGVRLMDWTNLMNQYNPT
jgi:hypothetical protein